MYVDREGFDGVLDVRDDDEIDFRDSLQFGEDMSMVLDRCAREGVDSGVSGVVGTA